MKAPKNPRMKRRDNHKFGEVRAMMNCRFESMLNAQYRCQRIGQFTMDCLSDDFEPTPAPVLALAPLQMPEPTAFVWERDINKVS